MKSVPHVIHRSGHVRIYEHGLALANSDSNSVLFQHFDETGHTFDLKNPLILDTEVLQFKKEFPDMLYIDSISTEKQTYIN